MIGRQVPYVTENSKKKKIMTALFSEAPHFELTAREVEVSIACFFIEEAAKAIRFNLRESEFSPEWKEARTEKADLIGLLAKNFEYLVKNS